MASTAISVQPHHISKTKMMLPSPAIQVTILESILFVSFTVATVLVLLPLQRVNENKSLVPISVFNALPSSTFHAFMICIIFAFSGAFSALMIPNKPRIASFCGFYSIASIALAMIIFIWAVSHQAPWEH